MVGSDPTNMLQVSAHQDYKHANNKMQPYNHDMCIAAIKRIVRIFKTSSKILYKMDSSGP